MLVKWRLRLSEFDFKIVHLAGIKKAVPDTMHRFKTNDERFTDRKGDLPIASVELSEDKTETFRSLTYPVSYARDHY